MDKINKKGTECQDNLTPSELASWLTLSFCPGLGPRAISNILELYGSPANFIANLPASGQQLQLTSKQIEACRQTATEQIEQALRWQEAPNQHILTRGDRHYPKLLAAISDPPTVLFVKGRLEALLDPQLAMVGSRSASAYGKNNAYEFARSLSCSGITITSGLAQGIDAKCHQGALAAQGNTIAVCGTGLAVTYPKEHKKLADLIAEQGALVSELPLSAPPRPYNFPRRNRIISGLALGTIVIEANNKSGSLITARMAMEQGREVFALPGSIHSPQSKGCHQLIRQGAKLTETVQDILEECYQNLQLALTPNEPNAANQEQQDSIQQLLQDPLYRRLLDSIGPDSTSTEQIIADSGLTAKQVSSMLLTMELYDIIAATANGYARIK